MYTKTKLKILTSILIIYAVCRFLPFLSIYGTFLTIRPIANLLLNSLDMLIFPFVFIVGGVLTLRLKSLGRVLLFISLGMDLTIRLFMIANFWYQVIKLLPTMSSESTNITVSFPFAWPMYIISVLEFIFLIYLTNPKIKEQFK